MHQGLKKKKNRSKFSPSPPDPHKPVNHGLRPQEAEPSKIADIRKLRNANAVPMSQKFPKKSPLAPSHGRNGFGGRRGWSARAPPPGQNLTSGVNRLGPRGSQLGDPNPNPDPCGFSGSVPLRERSPTTKTPSLSNGYIGPWEPNPCRVGTYHPRYLGCRGMYQGRCGPKGVGTQGWEPAPAPHRLRSLG